MIMEELEIQRQKVGSLIIDGNKYSDILFHNDDLDVLVNKASKDPNAKIKTVIIDKETVSREEIEKFKGIVNMEENKDE